MTYACARSRDGLVGYDAALTQLRSRVQFPVFVRLLVLIGSFALYSSQSHFTLIKALAQVKNEFLVAAHTVFYV